MDAQQYLLALRKRWIVILVMGVLGLAGGYGYASSQPVEYEATSGVLLASSGGDTTQEQLQGATFAQDVVESYVELATEPIVLGPVIDKLGLNETSGHLAGRVSADLSVGTVIIRITATDRSPVRAAEIANAVASSLSDAAKDLSTTGKQTAIIIHRTAVATAPTAPSSPNWPFLLVSGAGIGLLVGLAYALGRQLLSTKVTSEDELRSTPGLDEVPFLGTLSHRRRRNQSANVIMADPHGIPAEEYRRVITNIEFAGVDQRIRSVTVTSAMPGDGKSTTSINVAASAAEREQRVLLVDGDLRRPSVADYLGIDGSVGLANVLLGTARPADAIQRIGAMDVLPSGIVPPNVTQLVTSESMRRLFGELLMRYDFVVVDAPPLLPVVDALTFSRLTDGAVVVARQRTTRRKQFAMAVESLLQVDAKVVGVVLNDVTRAESGYRYGYGYAAKDLTLVRTVTPSRDVTATFFPAERRHGARRGDAIVRGSLSEPVGRPLRLLVSLPSRSATTNPYLLQLLEALEGLDEQVHIELFSWRRVLLGRYDVFHVHWPERLVRGSSRIRTVGKQLRFTALLIRLRVVPVAVVRTKHNLAAHETGGRVERRLLGAFDRSTTLWIRLNPFTSVPDTAPVRTILHGHYRAWFEPSDAVAVPGRLLFVGLLRRYKGIEELLTTFHDIEDPHVSLRLVGGAQDQALARAIEQAGRDDSRITSRIEYVPDSDLVAEVALSRLVVLPYRAVHNSGAAILALSLGRPVLMPATDTTRWLQEEVGNGWLQTYEMPLTPETLRQALAAAPTGTPPRLERRDWAPIAQQHLAAFRRAADLVRQSRRYST